MIVCNSIEERNFYLMTCFLTWLTKMFMGEVVVDSYESTFNSFKSVLVYKGVTLAS